MTENEKKIEIVEQRYKKLRLILDFSPIIVAFLLVVTLSVSITQMAYTIKILQSERAQDQARESMLHYREERRQTEQKIMDNQTAQIELLNQLLLNQTKNDLKGTTLSKSALDSLKILIINSHKN